MGNQQALKAAEEAYRIAEDLRARVLRFRQVRRSDFSAIPAAKKRDIFLSSAIELVDQFDAGVYTCREVMLVFIERASSIGLANNYLLDEMFEEALEQAERCDRVRQTQAGKASWRPGRDRAKCFPPFYGLPMSLKENIFLKGRQTYLGYSQPINPIPTVNPICTQLILATGAIPFVRTNVPQACKTCETNNNMFGYCHNSWKAGRSCGGSSGGEGGLIGARCSPLGFGNDIGGSLRIPSEFNGLCTLKPVSRSPSFPEVFYGKTSNGNPIRPEFGAMAHSVRDVVLFSQFVWDCAPYERIPAQLHDVHFRLLPFNYELFEGRRPLTIGYITHLERVNCSPSHERAVRMAIEALRERGHTVVDMVLPGLQQLFLYLVQTWMSDSSLSVFSEIDRKEASIPEYRIAHIVSKIPWFLRVIIMKVRRLMQILRRVGYQRLAEVLSSTRPLSLKDYFHLNYDVVQSYGKAIVKEVVEKRVDAWITPGFAVPAPPHGLVEVLSRTQKLDYLLAYTSGWNILEYPVGSLPITLVQAEETIFTDRFNDNYTTAMRECLEGAEGLPVGVQVVSLPNRDEVVLRVMSELEASIPFYRIHRSPVTEQR